MVEPLEAEEKSAGGIYLPEGAQEAPREGKVIAVGPGRVLESGERLEMSVKEGDIVIYTKYGGNEITIDDTEYLMIDESSLLAIKTKE